MAFDAGNNWFNRYNRFSIYCVSVFFTFFPVTLWISALAAGVRVSIFTLVGMRLRRVIPSRIVNPLIKAHKAGLDVTINQLESHYLAGGNVDRVVNALNCSTPCEY